MIAENLRLYLLTSFPPQKVLDVRIGLGYTAAQLEDGSVGTAYTFRHEALGGCSVFRGKRPLSGRSTVELLDYLTSKDPIEAAVGLAVANALANRPSPKQQEGDILDQLAPAPEDRVGMVGYFGPLVEPLKARVCELLIFERNLARVEQAPKETGVQVFSDAEIEDKLPLCNVALITSTALINQTLDALLAATRCCREVVLVGASTPLVPDVFRPAGVSLLSGIVVVDPAPVLQVVSEGGGMESFGPYVRKVNVRAL